jgi:signal transduction histidine kinase
MKRQQELKKAYDEIRSVNYNLELLILARTKHIEFQNRQLTEYAFFNSHKVRGPLARIIGIVQLMEIEPELIYKENLITKLSVCSRELDGILHEIRNLLESEIDADNRLEQGLLSSSG